MRWTQQAWQAHLVPDDGPAVDGQAVWSWRRDRGVKLAGMTRQRRWQTTPLTGESTEQPLKPLRGESRDVRAVPDKPVCVVSFLHTVLRAQSALGFPCALFLRGMNQQNSGVIAR